MFRIMISSKMGYFDRLISHGTIIYKKSREYYVADKSLASVWTTKSCSESFNAGYKGRLIALVAYASA